MRLHQLNKAFYLDSIERDIRYSLSTHDKAILIEDAVLRLIDKNDPLLNTFQKAHIDVYVLESDIKAYGLSIKNNSITTLTDAEWVTLTSKCNQQVAW